ncbi:MAG TPA: epoxide hydrolase [Pyrinomonadaceae bacterium]|nr:epoxide hydrolase [Pyrinomonadaceae bacterium]
MNVRPFKLHVPTATLDELRARLASTRWPDEVQGAEWDYGSNLAYVKELATYWQNDFDWRAQEEAINAFAHFRARVDDLHIHFIHERGRGLNPMPLIITHGWPSSFFQMLKLIPRLTDPERFGGDPLDSFDVIVPSLPGYGFSDKPSRRGINSAYIAELWAKLMIETLNYPRFAAQGGDIGGGVTTRLGLQYPQNVIGLHVTDVAFPYLGPEVRPLSPAEQKFLDEERCWEDKEGAYMHIQATKPQTLSYGLNDSPVGLAAWIVEKFRAWSDCNGHVEERFTKDELLTNLTIYWVTETINSSIRLYYEHRHHPTPLKLHEGIKAPTAVALFPKDISRPPREWAERAYNVRRWTVMPRGGHFAAQEEPDLLAEDIRAFFRMLR